MKKNNIHQFIVQELYWMIKLTQLKWINYMGKKFLICHCFFSSLLSTWMITPDRINQREQACESQSRNDPNSHWGTQENLEGGIDDTCQGILDETNKMKWSEVAASAKEQRSFIQYWPTSCLGRLKNRCSPRARVLTPPSIYVSIILRSLYRVACATAKYSEKRPVCRVPS